MDQELITCIPNFSDARRPEVIESIRKKIAAVPGTLILDQHMDLDHNRSVITFAGPPDTIADAAFAGIREASLHIDLDHHTGEHPRIGATDVVPFVPFSGVSLETCVEIARSLGQRVGSELGIPVYLYEKAAVTPERVNLENIRRGEYESLKTAIHEPDRHPDFGPAEMGPAGATVIGARYPLAAFNVYLNTEDLSIARKISRAVRHSSGGLRYVKALGMLVDGLAQVSMNLTDTTKTPVARVVELIRREAARYGVQVHHSELVGLIKQDALIDAARWYLQLDQFEPDQLLETRIHAAQRMQKNKHQDFLEQVASDSPAPGGGSAAAYAGALAAALTGMVARLTSGRKKFSAVDEEMQNLIQSTDLLREKLLHAVQEDTEAFMQVMQAFRLPKDSPEQARTRSEMIQSATLYAGEVPLETATLAVQVMETAVAAAEKGNPNAISDSAAACSLARAAFAAAAMNVEINAVELSEETAETWHKTLNALHTRADTAEDKVRTALKKRANLTYHG